MAHLLIQDSPAHLCGNKKCPENNILSVNRIKPVSHSPFGNQNGFGGMNPTVYDNELIPSIGRSFNLEQCNAVKAFLKEYKQGCFCYEILDYHSEFPTYGFSNCS